MDFRHEHSRTTTVGRQRRRSAARGGNRSRDRTDHIGRGLNADLRFEDQRVSRTHAILVGHGRTIRLLDDRSAHGTFLNGRRVIAANIQNGDVIRFGPVVVQYVEVR